MVNQKHAPKPQFLYKKGSYSKLVLTKLVLTNSLLSSEDAGHRDWRNVRKNHLQNTAKKPEKPTTTTTR